MERLDLTAQYLPGTIWRYAKGPTALLQITTDLPEGRQVYGMQCASGEGMFVDYHCLVPTTSKDEIEWQAHQPFRAPYAAHHQSLMKKDDTMQDISFDLETLSTRPNAAIISIGAVAFDRDSGKIGTSLYLEIAVDDAIKHGHVSGSTIGWWITQGGSAKSVFSGKHEKVNLHTALCRVKAFVMACGPDARVWGNGSTADITWLESAFASAGGFDMAVPWKYWNIRDVRTTVDDAALPRDAVPREGTHHNALDDAVHQAKLVIAARAAIRGKTTPAMGGVRYFRDPNACRYVKHQKGKPAAHWVEVEKDEYEAAQVERYWHHPESNAYFKTAVGECLSETCPDAQLCNQVTKAEWDAQLAAADEDDEL